MNKRITTRQDLIELKLELRRQLDFKKDQIRQDFLELKEEISPALKVASVIGNVTSRSRNNVILQTGANLAIDWATHKLLSKSNFLFKLLTPTLLKNVASHFLGKNGKPVSS